MYIGSILFTICSIHLPYKALTVGTHNMSVCSLFPFTLKIFKLRLRSCRSSE